MAKYISGNLTGHKVQVNTFSAEFSLFWHKGSGFFSETAEIDLTKNLCHVQIAGQEKIAAAAAPKGLNSFLSGLTGGNANIMAACALLNGKTFLLQVNEEEYAKLRLYARLNANTSPPGPPASANNEELIKKLLELKEAGLLTEQEFQSKKEKLPKG